jgi:hypothetical protein
MTMTPAELSARGRIGAHTRWSRETDRLAAMAPAHRGQQARFEREVDPNSELDPAERAFRAEHARKAHMQRMTLAAAKARKAKSG